MDFTSSISPLLKCVCIKRQDKISFENILRAKTFQIFESELETVICRHKNVTKNFNESILSLFGSWLMKESYDFESCKIP